MEAFLHAIPKVELHCHLLGTVRPATFIDLARKAGAPINSGTQFARKSPMVQQPRWAEMCARILQQCEHLQGGRDKLAGFLGVQKGELDEWLAARSGPPRAVFERAMELILAEHDRRAAREAAGVPRRRRTDRPTA